jgi:serine protease Do
VVAIGSPFGMENSVTAGIVSATLRDLPDEQIPFIQTDVAVNMGNSGGPLFNLAGEVVGINSQIYSPNAGGGYVGLSFAIPIDIANDVSQQLIETGQVTRGQIGVKIEGVDSARAEYYGLERPRGALVKEVFEGEPADKAGIRPDDIILSVDGRPVEFIAALPAMISAIRPGNSAELELWSDGKLKKVTVNVVEMKEEAQTAQQVQGRGGRAPQSGQAEPTVLGLYLRPLTTDERQQSGTRGSLVVANVEGAAAAAGVQRGDIIIGAAGTQVRTVAELERAVKRSAGSVVTLLIQRGDREVFPQVRKE